MSCGLGKHPAEFNKNRNAKDGRHAYCRSCNREKSRAYHAARRQSPEAKAAARQRSREWRKNNPERAKANEWAGHVRRKYGITVEEYDEWLARGACEICKTDINLCLDHCHETGAIRGVLCRKCNAALGQLGDSLEAARRVVAYLEAQ